MNNTNDDEELSSMVDQFKEIALRVGSRSCVMIAQVAKLQKEKDFWQNN